MSHYRRLTLVEREELSRMFIAGHTLRAAAHALGRAPSTVSRELARHRRSRVTYRAVHAHRRASRWAHVARKPRPRKVLNWHSPAHAFRELLH